MKDFYDEDKKNSDQNNLGNLAQNGADIYNSTRNLLENCNDKEKNNFLHRNENNADTVNNPTAKSGNETNSAINPKSTSGGSAGSTTTAGSTEATAGGAGATVGGAGATAGGAGATVGGAGATVGGAGATAGGAGATVGGAGATVGGAGAVAGGGILLPIIILIAVIVLFVFFIIGAVTILTEGGVFSMASAWYSNVKLHTETKTTSIIAQIQDFIGADGHFGFNVTEDVDVSEDTYDKNNEYDQGYINQYKLLRMLLKNSYKKAVDEIEDKCETEKWDKDKTLEILEEKYPNGYEDVYKNINYGELMNILDFGFDTGFYTDDETITANNPLAVELMKNKFTLNYEENAYYKNFYNISYDEKTVEETITLPIYGYDPVSLQLVEVDSKTETKTITYVEPTIDVYCLNDIYEMLGVDPNSVVKNGLQATYKEKMDAMLMQAKLNCSDIYGNPRTIYNTLNLDSTTVQWSHSFSGDTINDVLRPEIIKEANGDVPKAIYKALRNAGFTHEGACGMLGNIYAENHFRLDWKEGDQGSSGLCQWRGDRKAALMTYANSNGYEYHTLEAQLGYLMYELPTQCSGHYNDIKNATDVDDATGLVARYFERCSFYASKSDWEKANVPYEWSRYGWSERIGRYIIDYNVRHSAAVKYYNEYKEN